MRAVAALVVWACAAVALAGCATAGRLSVPSGTLPPREFTTTVALHGHPFLLHLAAPARPAAAPAALVLYASGDGGWFGSAVQMFRAIAVRGYPVVGLSARAFLKIERPGHAPLSPAQLTLDYAAILSRAREALALPPQAPAVLTGWSRGAAFAVLAAAETHAPADAGGVVAIGLAEGEDLAIDGPDDETDDIRAATGGRTAAGARWPFAPYTTLATRIDAPCAVIQATGDGYLPADRARVLFGPARPTRRFFEVPGRNHRFSGAWPQFLDALGQALQWTMAGAVTRRRGSGAAALALVAATAGAAPARTVAQATETVTLRGHPLSVRTYGTRGGSPVVVTSGDGGWIHLGPHVAEALAERGYFVVGVDARAYLSSFTSGSTALRPEDEPGDFRVLADFAGHGSPVKPILIGVSEGAGLSLLAATDPRTREAIGGVLGLGLPDLNELGWHWKDALIYLTHGTPNEPLFSTAALASRVAPLPLAAIHSTHDEFAPLGEVQRVLAAAHEPKRLWVVEAADHRFSDALPEFDRRLDEALAWIAQQTRSR